MEDNNLTGKAQQPAPSKQQEQRPLQEPKPAEQPAAKKPKIVLPAVIAVLGLIFIFAIVMANSGGSHKEFVKQPQFSAPAQAPAAQELMAQELEEPTQPMVEEITTSQELIQQEPALEEPIGLQAVEATQEPLPVREPEQPPAAASQQAIEQPAAATATPAPAPQDASGFYQRGEQYYYNGDFDNAISDFKKAVELDPKYTDAYCEMGVAYMEKPDWDAAILQLGKCIEIDPSHPKAQYALAVSYARKPSPDVKAAREHFEIAKKLGFVYPQWFEDFLKRLEAGERFEGQEQQ